MSYMQQQSLHRGDHPLLNLNASTGITTTAKCKDKGYTKSYNNTRHYFRHLSYILLPILYKKNQILLLLILFKDFKSWG